MQAMLSNHAPAACAPCAAAWSPPTVADAKLKFTEAFKKPLPAIYSTVVQELLVQQHLYRWNKRYQYNEVRPGTGRSRLACTAPWPRLPGASHGTCASPGSCPQP